MNKQEALAKLHELQRTTACADYIESVGWNSDIEPVERLAKQLEIYSGDVKKMVVKIYDAVVSDWHGYRRGITWADVYDLFRVMESAIEAMP
jgi:hypothetical protein